MAYAEGKPGEDFVRGAETIGGEGRPEGDVGRSDETRLLGHAWADDGAWLQQDVRFHGRCVEFAVPAGVQRYAGPFRTEWPLRLSGNPKSLIDNEIQIQLPVVVAMLVRRYAGGFGWKERSAFSET